MKKPAPTTVKATPQNPLPAPPHGGDWRREANGDLTLVHATTERSPEPAPTPPGADPSTPQPLKE